jgi:hypothetical protein
MAESITDSEGDLQIGPSHEPVGPPGETTLLGLPEALGSDPETGEAQPLQRVTIHAGGGVSTLVGDTPATSADAADITMGADVRAMILATAGVQARLVELVEAPADALRVGAKSLSDDLQGTLTCREIEWVITRRQLRVASQPSPVVHTGSGRKRPHSRAGETVRLAVKALGLIAGGLSPTEADEVVAAAAGVEGARRTTEEITLYRNRVVHDLVRLRPE